MVRKRGGVVEVKAEAEAAEMGMSGGLESGNVGGVMEKFQGADYISLLRLPYAAPCTQPCWHGLMIDVTAPSCSFHVQKVANAIFFHSHAGFPHLFPWSLI